MKELRFPLLKPYQIEVRVGQVSATGCSLLLYKTSRTDAEVLDTVVGVGNWQKRFYTLQGVGIGEQVRSIVVCSVGIYDDDKHEWVWKDDSGTESQVEQDKGVCSDAFKRASGGSSWGVGRELYYTGFIFVKCETVQKASGRGYELADKYKTFEVEAIEWNEKPLSLKLLIIKDNKGEIVYQYPKQKNVAPVAQKAPQNADEDYGEAIIQETKEKITEITGKYDMGKYANFKSWLNKNFGTTNIGDLTETQGKQVVKALGGK